MDINNVPYRHMWCQKKTADIYQFSYEYGKRKVGTIDERVHEKKNLSKTTLGNRGCKEDTDPAGLGLSGDDLRDLAVSVTVGHVHHSLRLLELAPKYFFLKDSNAVSRIHDILVWIRIRIRGYMPMTDGSGCGSGSCYFHH
jgi:hypothetical protein